MFMKRSPRYTVELDGAICTLIDGRLETVADLRDVPGDQWFVSDLGETVSRVMSVEGDYKYAEHMVARELQESGEFDEPVSIISHWKKKKGRNSSDIFFTAVPTRRYYQYFENIKEHTHSTLFFPLYAVLFSILKRVPSHMPVAVILRHDRYADLVVGTGRRVYHARHFVAYDTGEEQIATLWDTIRADISAVAADHRIKIKRALLLNWIDDQDLPEWPDESECELCPLEEETVEFDTQAHSLSFLKAVRGLSGLQGISPLSEKLFYYARRGAPWLSAIVLLAVFLLAGGYFLYSQKADSLQAELTRLEQKISGIQVKVESRQDQYKNTFAFVKKLAYYEKAPAYREVINDISTAFSSEMKIEVLKIDYTDDDVQVEIFGRVADPFDKAHRWYQNFLRILKAQGYALQESRFDTRISASEFVIKFSKRVR